MSFMLRSSILFVSKAIFRNHKNQHRYVYFLNGKARIVETFKKDFAFRIEQLMHAVQQIFIGKLLSQMSGSATLAALLLMGGLSHIPVQAAPNDLPSGFSHGQSVNVNNPTSTGGQSPTMTITTTAQRSIGSFNTFNIGSRATVNVVQPGANAMFLARVRQNSPTEIYGRLNSNGGVGIVNPAGIYIGPGGLITTNGFLGTTQDIRNQDFLGGNFIFGSENSRTNPFAKITNEGTIRVGNNRFVVLVAPKVENKGVIQAPGGNIHLGSQKEFRLMTEDGVIIKAENTLPDADAAFRYYNTFTGIVNNTGRIEVASIGHNSTGDIVLYAAKGDVSHSGTMVNDGGPGSRTQLIGHDIEVEGDITVKNDINLFADDDIFITSHLKAGDDIRLTTSDSNGNIELGESDIYWGPFLLRAGKAAHLEAGDEITMNVGGSIYDMHDSPADLEASYISLIAGGDIKGLGSGAPYLDINANVLNLQAGGNAFVREADSVRVERGLVDATSGTLDLKAQNDLLLDGLFKGNQLLFTAGKSITTEPYFAGSTSLLAGGSNSLIQLQANNGAISLQDDTLLRAGTIILDASGHPSVAKISISHDSLLDAGKAARLYSDGDMNISGSIKANEFIKLDASGQSIKVAGGGSVSSQGDIEVSAKDLLLGNYWGAGLVEAKDTLKIDLTGDLLDYHDSPPDLVADTMLLNVDGSIKGMYGASPYVEIDANTLSVKAGGSAYLKDVDSLKAVYGQVNRWNGVLDLLANDHLTLSGYFSGNELRFTGKDSLTVGGYSHYGTYINGTGRSSEAHFHSAHGPILFKSNSHAHADTIHVDADGSFNDANITQKWGSTIIADRSLSLESRGNMHLAGWLYGGKEARLTAGSDVVLASSGYLGSGGDITLFTEREAQLFGSIVSDGSSYCGGDIWIGAIDDIRLSGGLIKAINGGVTLDARNFISILNEGEQRAAILAKKDIHLLANQDYQEFGHLYIEGDVGSKYGDIFMQAIDMYLPGRIAAFNGDVWLTTGLGAPERGYVSQTGWLSGKTLHLNLAGSGSFTPPEEPDYYDFARIAEQKKDSSIGFGGGRFDNADFTNITGSSMGNVRYEDTDGINATELYMGDATGLQIVAFTPGNTADNGFAENLLSVTGGKKGLGIQGGTLVELLNGNVSSVTTNKYRLNLFRDRVLNLDTYEVPERMTLLSEGGVNGGYSKPGSGDWYYPMPEGELSTNEGILIDGSVNTSDLFIANNTLSNSDLTVTENGSVTVTAEEGGLAFLRSDKVAIDGAINTSLTNGIIALAPTSSNTSIGLGGAPGTFNLTQSEFNLLSGKELWIGSGPSFKATLIQPSPVSRQQLVGRLVEEGCHGTSIISTGFTVDNVYFDDLSELTPTQSTIRIGRIDLGAKAGTNLTLNTKGAVLDNTPADDTVSNINLSSTSNLYITGNATGLSDRYSAAPGLGVGSVGSTFPTPQLGDLDVTRNDVVTTDPYVYVSSAGFLFNNSRIDEAIPGIYVNVADEPFAGGNSQGTYDGSEVANLNTLSRKLKKVTGTTITNETNNTTLQLEGSQFDEPGIGSGLPEQGSGIGLTGASF